MSSPLPDRVRERFVTDTATHEMTIKHDDGVYRHVSFARPETIAYSYSLVTWPGHLAYTGDMGAYLFSRERDMFPFFAAGRDVNPDYWSGKVLAEHPHATESFSVEEFHQHVREFCDGATASDLLAQHPLSIEEAHYLLDAAGVPDFWEWNLYDYDFRFLWACHAIRAGVKRYQEHHEAAVAVGNVATPA